jgi:hypothetical protein
MKRENARRLEGLRTYVLDSEKFDDAVLEVKAGCYTAKFEGNFKLVAS